jgi:hypothetical protein
MRNALQIVLAIFSVVPLAFGISGVFFGAGRWLPGEAISPELDNQYRFLSACYLSIAFLLWWAIPHIERHATLIRIIAFVLFLGGLSRLWSFVDVGWGSQAQVAAMLIELAAPLVAVWQAIVARRHVGA